MKTLVFIRSKQFLLSSENCPHIKQQSRLVRITATNSAAPLRAAVGVDVLLGRLVYRQRWMFRLGFGVYMAPSVVLAIFSCWFGAGLDICKHVQSLSYWFSGCESDYSH